MNNTPTPRTDEQRKIIDSIRPDGCHRVEYLLGFASILETELAAVTEQLKAEQENLTKSCMRERLADEDRKYVENQRDDAFFQLAEAQEKLAAVTEQRDEYKLVLQSYDRHNHEMATKLEIVAEQLNEARDTIAMLTNTLRNNNDAARAGYEELKADLHRRYRCFVCRDTGKTDGALGFNGYGPCPLCSLPNTQDQERTVKGGSDE